MPAAARANRTGQHASIMEVPHESPAPGFAIPLKSFSVVEVSGVDARDFLHGQFTCDVKAIEAGRATWGGYCSPKGRLLATFLLVPVDDRFRMVLPREISAAVTRRLSMFVLRSKVRLQAMDDALALVGLCGQPAADRLRSRFGTLPDRALATLTMDAASGSVQVLRVGPELSEPRFLLMLPAGQVETCLRDLSLPDVPESSWHRMDVLAGIPWVVAATQEQFLPQMANLDRLGGVSFSKGCYPGQEVVARTQFRGQVKRHMFLAHADAAGTAPGDPVFGGGEGSAGQVLAAVSAPAGGVDLLVVLVAAAAQGELRLGAPDGPPLALRRLPDDPDAAAAA